ncbi:hypothetical protein Hdeb2414_s0026g00676731 [Helianthus debilis subsp. tardiflorus]
MQPPYFHLFPLSNLATREPVPAMISGVAQPPSSPWFSEKHPRYPNPSYTHTYSRNPSPFRRLTLRRYPHPPRF